MNNFHSIILGIVQGLTEFLPISSSGHLLLFSKILNIEPPSILFDLILHLGTLIAVLIYFRKLIIQNIKNYKLIFLIILSTLITGILYLIFNSYFEKSFEEFSYLPFFFIITSFFLLFFYLKNKRTKTLNSISFYDAIIIGLFQGIAILPGISRSGFTFISSLLVGMKDEDAFKYSFLLSIPAILLSFLYKTYEYIKNPFPMNSSGLILGCLFSFIFGALSINLFYRFVKIRKFIYFSIYLFVLGLILIIIIF